MVCLLASSCLAQSVSTEVFRDTYPLTQNTINVRNDHGNVKVIATDRADVQVEATKRAVPPAQLALAEVAIQNKSGPLCIATKYPGAKSKLKNWFGFATDLCTDWQNISDLDPATLPTIDYTLWVPRNANLKILVDRGDVDIEGTTGAIFVDIQTGHLTARDVSGDCKLYGSYSGVNVTLNTLPRDTHIDSSVGPLVVTFAPAVSARVHAHGARGIVNDFGWQERSQQVEGKLGDGRVSLDVNNGGGRVELRKLQPPAPPAVTNKVRRPAVRPK